ncbi:FecCD family ABC transporter permease [Pseudomonas capsici]|uniref:Iron ABC transporter permease n=1 Tax=Pseudomonas capsici TaxID=2810614 RepID=A0ABT3BY45_9PSED|nr:MULTISPECIES: iron ABC transporter permease [Pseudomonas]MBN6715624.1 iron ABC transporter permease [Pseudomonas capsici]MBN6720659.1 iron ABC transporter permease [Pseudomonas capsici]MBN6725501.1 iron ABC transporter permease [Pseudomonas capsici]MBX8474328.1 iron ABC transporter permease [Pseudomonas cichorii]MBX8606366.1 iron ABC transporter permease [Pseudomonas cichorii]
MRRTGLTLPRALPLLPWIARPIDLISVLLLTGAVIALALYALTVGSFSLSMAQAWQAVLTPEQVSPTIRNLLWELRLPRVVLAILAGAAMSLAGLLMQSLTRNPLAAPGLVGVESGASVTMLLIIVLWPGLLPLEFYPLAALAGGLAVAFFVALLSWRQGISPLRLILVGVGLTAMLSAVADLLITYGNIDQVESALMWLGGSLHRAGWPQVNSLCLWLLLAGVPLLFCHRQLNLLQLGEKVALSRGLNVTGVMISLLLCSVMLTAAAVANVGTMTFVGLVAPHLARQLAGDRHGALMPLSALFGALLVLAGDTLGRGIFPPLQLPAGLVVAIIGAPYLMVLLARQRNR